MSYRNWARGLEGKPLLPENEKNPWDDSKVIGGGEENLPDGRSFKHEVWVEASYLYLTYTFPPSGLEDYSKEQIIEYLISQKINIDINKFPVEKMELLRDANRYRLTITIGDSVE